MNLLVHIGIVMIMVIAIFLVVANKTNEAIFYILFAILLKQPYEKNK